ncbi:hypothetical protein ACFQ1Q_09090 [Winogradskyella litorisediminis]|uniref:PH domain-containing protein n=1 Tax=Winogradskyella litorisediminis TaxID=1156618 RepID=A0ABW3N6Y4_9FLAO
MKIFKEEQRFTQLWLIVLMIVSVIVPVAVILKDADNMSTSNLITSLSVIILAPAIIFLFKLKTRMDEKGIYYQFIPFHFKKRFIAWNEISNAYVRTYDPIGEYGGWGIKGGVFWNKKKGIAVNVKGDIGIQLELKNGKKILIGTQLKEQAQSTINNYRKEL